MHKMLSALFFQSTKDGDSERRLLVMSGIICAIQLAIAAFLGRRMIPFLDLDTEHFYAIYNLLS